MADFFRSLHIFMETPGWIVTRFLHILFLGVWVVVWTEPLWRLASHWRAWVFPRGWRSWGAYAAVYPLTVFAAHRLGFFSFSARPVPEGLAVGAMALLCLALLCAGAAARIWPLSAPRCALALFGAGLSMVLFLFATQLWEISVLPLGKPLARFSVTPDGLLRIVPRAPQRSPLNPANGRVIVPIQTARCRWPEMGFDQTIVLRVSATPGARWVVRQTVGWFLQSGWNRRPHGPWVDLSVQSLEVDPPGLFVVYVAEDGETLSFSKTAL